MLKRVIAVGLSALIGGALALVSPVPVKALSDYNVIAVDPNTVFMADLDGLEIDDVVISELTGDARIIQNITPDVLRCSGYCDVSNFSVDEWTKGYLVEYNGVDLYGWFTEDHWTIQPYECGELAFEFCPLIMDAPNAFPTCCGFTAFMPDVTGLSVGDTVYSTVGAAWGHRTATVTGIEPVANFTPESYWALPQGPLKGSIVTFDDNLYPGYYQDHLFFKGAARRTAVSFYPGTAITGPRSTYSIMRCTSGGDGMTSSRIPKGCKLIKKWSGAGRNSIPGFEYQRVTYAFTALDKAAGYLRFVVTTGRVNYYSPAYRVNE